MSAIQNRTKSLYHNGFRLVKLIRMSKNLNLSGAIVTESIYPQAIAFFPKEGGHFFYHLLEVLPLQIALENAILNPVPVILQDIGNLASFLIIAHIIGNWR